MDARNRKSLRTAISNLRNIEKYLHSLLIVFEHSKHSHGFCIISFFYYYFTISISKRLKKNLQNIKEESNKGNC